MTPGALAAQLRKRGLVILAVNRHRSLPDVVMVYLHGNAGQWAHQEALNTVAEVPGVVAVTESVSTSTILLVQVPNRR